MLYHWRTVTGSTALALSEKSYAYTAGLRALNDHVSRLKLSAVVEEAPGVPFYRLRFLPPRPAPLVSIIIPTRDKVDLLRMSVGSILAKTSYEPFEILVIDNGSVEDETKAYLAELAKDTRVRVLPYPKPFNFSAINNFGANAAKGDILALLNNDIEVIAPDWLTEMVSFAAQEEIGCVGANSIIPTRRSSMPGSCSGSEGSPATRINILRPTRQGISGAYGSCRISLPLPAPASWCARRCISRSEASTKLLRWRSTMSTFASRCVS